MLKLECYEEAIKQEVYIKTIKEDIKMIEEISTWDVIDFLHGKYIIGLKCIYKIY